jgi:hypothetical protein
MPSFTEYWISFLPSVLSIVATAFPSLARMARS